MSRIKVILTFAFVLALFAGAAVGMLGARIPQSHEPRSWMADELSLSAAQRDQMRAIWQDVSKNRSHEWDARRAMDKQRNDQIVALLSPEQKAKFDEINQQFSSKVQDLSKQREQAFADGQERTKQILTPEQWAKYEQLMQKRREAGQNNRGGANGAHHAPGTEPSANLSGTR